MGVRVDITPAQRKLQTLRRLIDQGLVRGNSGPFLDMRKQWGARYSADLRRRFLANSRGGGPDGWAPLAKSTLMGRRGVRATAAAQRDSGRKVAGAQKELAQAVRAVGFKRNRNNASNARRAATTARKARERLDNLTTKRAALLAGRSGRSSVARDTKKGGALTGVSGVSVEILRDTGILFGALTVGALGNVSGAIPLGIRFGFNTAVGHPKAKGITIGRLAALHNRGNARTHLPRRRILAPPGPQTLRGMRSDLHRAIDRCIKQAGLSRGRR